jgi:ketosteroid isomerase-like protein
MSVGPGRIQAAALGWRTFAVQERSGACYAQVDLASLGCEYSDIMVGPPRRAPMESDRDKAEVVATVVRFWQAYERKDLATLSNMLTTADDFTFFGSDAAEVVKTRREWEDLMRNDWQFFETIRFGEPSNIAIQISADKQLASIMYEVTDISLVGGKNVESLDRFAMTMRKENGAWRIVHGMTAVATKGESSAEIVARRRKGAPKP